MPHRRPFIITSTVMLKIAMLLLVTLLITNQCWFCVCLVINPPASGGGSTRGDPAPGRSPGPPPQLQQQSNLDQTPTTLLTVDDDTDNSIGNDRQQSCLFDGEIKHYNPNDNNNNNWLNFTITNQLFKSDVLVAGIIYKVILQQTIPTTMVDFVIISTINNYPAGRFIDNNNNIQQDVDCGPNIYKNQLLNNELSLNWTLNGVLHNRNNVTFEINYKFTNDPSIYGLIYSFPIRQDCQLHLKETESIISSHYFPHITDCQIWFPNHNTGRGLVIEIIRLNVPCSRGFIHFSGLNLTQQQHYFRNHRQAHLCGKLEELPEIDRHLYFPYSHTQSVMHIYGNPVFTLNYHLVDYCYNITFVTRNGSFELKPTGELQCTFKIYLPYGNRVALHLQIGDTSTSTGPPAADPLFPVEKPGAIKCDGLLTQLFDGDNVWSHCTKSGDAERQFEIMSRTNKVILKVSVHGSDSGGSALGLHMKYRAAPIEEIVGVCGFGWVALKQFCISAIEDVKLPWNDAEMECIRRGGHLASIRSEDAQNIINNVLLNSPGYRDHNAYWIGATDKILEGDYRWSDGLPFSYTNWFPGWLQHGHYNRQPNDDGLSEQDCVEVRRIYQLPTSTASLANGFMWNDRDCSTANYFICERLQNNEPLEDNWPPDCNRSIELSRQQPRTIISSPGFPRHYPDNADCITEIIAPTSYRLILDFEELVLENEPSCSYDFLEIIDSGNLTRTGKNSSKRLCGDWSSKLKLLRYVSAGSKIKLRFNSDYSHHFGGYRARVTMESASQCADDRLLMFNNSCYFFVSYPEVTWSTAQQICRGKKAQLSSVLSSDEEHFIKTNIRKSPEYRTSALYWLGGRAEVNSDFKWIDGNRMDYHGWLPGQKLMENDINEATIRCLGIQWTPSPVPMAPSGLYWKSRKCNTIGGYVCKRPIQLSGIGINFNKTVNGSEGNLTTPHYPENYYNQLDFSVKIIGPERTRIVIKFIKIDIEPQLECLYDYIELKSLNFNDNIKLCGIHDTNMERFNFVSKNNIVELIFHSDYSITASGFSLKWQAVDVSACPMQTLTAKEGILISPNYPDFILTNLDCTFTILAPIGKRIWLNFQHYDINNDNIDNNEIVDKIIDRSILEISLSKHSTPFQPYRMANLLTEGSFVSLDERIKIKLRTGDQPIGVGFRANYRIVSTVNEEKIIYLQPNTSGSILHLNYPESPSIHVNFLQRFIAPLGYIISLELYHVKLTDTECSDSAGIIEVNDNYYNDTSWKLCYDIDTEDLIVPVVPISVTSFLNTIYLRQKSTTSGVLLNGTIRVQPDREFKTKLLNYKEDQVESCLPNPCQNGGKCITKNERKFCRCPGHFTGLFCTLTKCELEPCVFGTCELTETSYKCHCKAGYVGPTCEQKRKPCEGNPCESRGVCIERGDGFQCRCHAWWEGPRCEKRMLHIPYKPLSERMFHEPFWLGLMTVFVVMAIIGLFWCAKRHFPEKIEKLLAEENDRNRSMSVSVSSLRSSSVREQLAVAASGANNTIALTPSPGPTAPRSLFGRLGIRKPSILSLTSPHASGHSPSAARTFSLDDLLKPPPRRTPSPKKKRNNSTPTKKNAAEKKQILQQLISPNSSKMSRKVSLGELMLMSETKNDQNPNDASVLIKETNFSTDDNVQSTLSDPKLEKKVTFARLLNKVSAEMSSGSDMELGIMQTNRLGCVFARPSSTPPSPNVDVRSPNSTSSNQGSDSLTSSDLAIPSALSSSISDLLNSRRSNRFHNGKQKPASADSILAMFRNFSSSSAGINLSSSLKVSPSTTPTASSPQDDLVGDDESSTSSIHTPVSFSSGAPESPILHRQNQNTIEVPVLDPLSAHKSSISGSNFLHPPTILLEIPSTINKCLSPIREMPTPLPSPIPSPALTPLMRRSTASSSIEEPDMSDDRISIELPNISISDGDDDDNMHRVQDIAIDPQAEDGLILEEAAAMQQNNKIKNRPQLFIQPQTTDSHPLVIPTLTVQTPSPTHTKSPTSKLPGSPPPHRSQQQTCFQFPSPKTTRKLYKDFDKPTSLDLPSAPPMITITCNMSEAESDAETLSPANKTSGHLSVNSTGMTYLSPFSMSARGDHTASESNLSSSGYSSMASPGPSRCGSSNPLCPSEMEDQGPSGSSGGSHRRPSPVLKTNSNSTDRSAMDRNDQEQRRGRSDSETLSDDPLIESNDEGIGTDHIDEKIEDGKVKSAKELQVFMVSENEMSKTLIDLSFAKKNLDDCCCALPPPPPSPINKTNSLQLPSIIVQCDPNSIEKHLSPMSSRSESPLSDRTTGLGRFSPQFYGVHKDLLPFTDSDGLYDFPSMDKMNISVPQHKKTGRKREKKSTRNCKTPSPTKSKNLITLHNHLDLPNKDGGAFNVPPPRKLSPKRRSGRTQLISSSSSSDSITSTKGNQSTPSPETIRWSSPIDWQQEKEDNNSNETDDGCDDVNSVMLPKPIDPSRQQKLSRLRAISHQIRFLRRLELNLKRRERTISPSDSLDSGDDSPRATSPLLQPTKGAKIEIRKSNSISKLQNNQIYKNRKDKCKKGEFLLTPEEKSWKRIVITGNGHSD